MSLVVRSLETRLSQNPASGSIQALLMCEMMLRESAQNLSARTLARRPTGRQIEICQSAVRKNSVNWQTREHKSAQPVTGGDLTSLHLPEQRHFCGEQSELSQLSGAGLLCGYGLARRHRLQHVSPS